MGAAGFTVQMSGETGSRSKTIMIMSRN